MTGATSVTIDQGVGMVTGSGVIVSPAATTTYSLTAANAAGTTTRTAIVTVEAPSTIGGWRSASAGSGFTFAIKTDGSLWAWGYNGESQLGIWTGTNQSAPMQVGTDTNWVDVSAGGSFTLALKADRNPLGLRQ